ncbi:MAG: 30S ribosomal protein S6 [Oscillospiraceae bacterium]|jgi:small subunit ribosomal protein S6|nr:30S ribosomal protein S6 [Oscillospiraceae bacterium]
MATQKYEVMLVYSMKNEEALTALKERFAALIEQNGTLTETKEWGKRILRYPIQKETEGYYVLHLFEAAPEFPAELNRVTGITDGVLRCLVTRQGE